MPRVSPKPNPMPDPVEGDAALRAALAAQITAEQKRRRDAEPDFGDSPYSPESPHSWFADRVIVAESEERSSRAALNPRLRGRDGGSPNPPTPGEPDLEDARRRLEDLRFLRKMDLGSEKRDVTTGDPGGAAVVSSAPAYLGELFAAAARAQATLAAALEQRPLPEFGMKIETPSFTTGAAVAVQASQNSGIQETDPDIDLATSNVGTIAGQIDVSRQLFERSMPGIDEVFAADIARALAAAVDVQLVAGTNANGQTKGLANSGPMAVAYTDASPTQAELVSKIWAAYSDVATVPSGYGTADPAEFVVIVHPRRLAWLAANADALKQLEPFGGIVPTGGIRLNLGAGTNEDEIYVIAKGESFIALGEPRIRVFPEVLSTSGTIRLRATQYVGAMFARAPNSIARISGTGLTPPAL